MAALRDGARETLETLLGARIGGMAPVGGGCVSPAWRVTFRDGGLAFVKTSDVPGLLAEEAYSLGALAGAVRGSEPGLRVPEVLAVSAGWLVLEWLEPGLAKPGAWRRAGEGLARLHRAGEGLARQHRAVRGHAPLHGAADASFGWDRDNFIGPLPQFNTPTDSWAAFWRDRRLRPQAEMAAGLLGASRLTRLEALYDRLDEVLAPGQDEGASLLHGDLWSGNLLMTADGAALVDPSSFRGHREVDLAMAALFGGVPAEFFSGYEAAWPQVPGCEERRSAYQLYYVLVHVNLFGGGYLRGVDEALGFPRTWSAN